MINILICVVYGLRTFLKIFQVYQVATPTTRQNTILYGVVGVDKKIKEKHKQDIKHNPK